MSYPSSSIICGHPQRSTSTTTSTVLAWKRKTLDPQGDQEARVYSEGSTAAQMHRPRSPMPRTRYALIRAPVMMHRPRSLGFERVSRVSRTHKTQAELEMSGIAQRQLQPRGRSALDPIASRIETDRSTSESLQRMGSVPTTLEISLWHRSKYWECRRRPRSTA